MQKRILLTGATGFIGSHLLPALLDHGWYVTALIHKKSFPRTRFKRRLKLIQGSITHTPLLRRLLARVDAVFHAAAFIPPDYEDSQYAEQCLQINSIATLKLAELAEEFKIKRLVFFSSAQGYSPSPKPLAENQSYYPSHKAVPYLASKLLGELYVEHLRLTRGLPAITLRVGSCYGSGMPERSVVARFMQNARGGQDLEVLNGGKATADFVYVGDVVKAALAALRKGDPGIYNVGSGKSCSVLELAQTVKRIFSSRAIKITLQPRKPSCPVHNFPALSIAKAASAWGYCPFNLEKGLLAYKKAEDKRP